MESAKQGPSAIRIYEVWNCYEEGDQATLWIRFDGGPQIIPFEEDAQTMRLVGPVERDRCTEIGRKLMELLKRLGVSAVYEQVADD